MKVELNLHKATQKYNVYIDELDEIKLNGKVGIITNPKVAGLWLGWLLERLKCDEYFIITVADGEEYKNMASVEQILEQLFVSKFDRSSMLIALGGGVISDMTGFVASIYERGINFINIPTTLLAQVDASVGGKTGVNNKFGKNLIGSFYQPVAVYCESRFLKTLPEREFAAGLAEAVKMAVMFDSSMLDMLENFNLKDEGALAKIIYNAVWLKADVVQQDEHEKGLRAVLNYGHTFAHVIENETNYKQFLHGEAVAIGMNMANALAASLGLMSEQEKLRIKRLLEKFSLPTTYKIADENSFYEAFFMDKKSENKKIKFILPKGIGAHEIRSDIKKEQVIEILREFR
ncbi:3-dehydroquinate synthase [Campylobacter suis]|uniref:3-dehydroquinate synthase n=1 Tax=Campylobacter suis TaxID=2790657 RepID=A0ABN7K404_9BACT|nr:3-dehydroquinate synthase [Campylobacter suis]CAD7286815.1 3-dehydroquinate synthase [Campylobacter suis]